MQKTDLSKNYYYILELKKCRYLTIMVQKGNESTIYTDVTFSNTHKTV